METILRTPGKPGGEAPIPEDAEAAFAKFQAHMEPRFNEAENFRVRMKELYTTRLMLAGAATISLFLLAFLLRTLIENNTGTDTVPVEIYTYAPLLAGLGLFAWAQGPRIRFARRYKENILPAVAGFFGKFDYSAPGGIGMNRLKPSSLIPSHDRYRHEDLFDGLYKDVAVEFCEARLTERRGSGKNRRTVTVFRGVFVLLTMNKPFRGMTVVRRDEGKIGNWLRGKFDKLEPVKLEDPEFERQFEVYSDDQVEARYLLTPAFMVRLMNLSKTVGSQRIQAAFFGSRLLIMIPTGELQRLGGLSALNLSVANIVIGSGAGGKLFEPKSIFRPVHASEDLHRLFGQFKAIIGIIDILKLYENTGL